MFCLAFLSNSVSPFPIVSLVPPPCPTQLTIAPFCFIQSSNCFHLVMLRLSLPTSYQLNSSGHVLSRLSSYPWSFYFGSTILPRFMKLRYLVPAGLAPPSLFSLSLIPFFYITPPPALPEQQSQVSLLSAAHFVSFRLTLPILV